MSAFTDAVKKHGAKRLVGKNYPLDRKMAQEKGETGRSSRVGELKLHDELVSQGPYYDRKHGSAITSDNAASILRYTRETRAMDAAEKARRKR